MERQRDISGDQGTDSIGAGSAGRGASLGPSAGEIPFSDRPLGRTSGRVAVWALGAAAALLGAGLLFQSASAEPAIPGDASSGIASPAEGVDASQEGTAQGTDVEAAFAKAGLIVDIDAQMMAFPAGIEVRHDNLEYLLVNPSGAVHESLFVTPVDALLLATAFLAVGAEPGSNVVYTAVDPPPTREEVRAGARTHEVDIPQGKPIFLHAAWKEAAGAKDESTGDFSEETVHFHRLEDLVIDLERDRTMRRHSLVWLGSRNVPGKNPGDAERFAAQATGNLMCVSFFSDGDTLLTTALPECVSQTAWIPNGWLMPQPGSEVLLIASSVPLDRVPESLASALPLVPEPEPRR